LIPHRTIASPLEIARGSDIRGHVHLAAFRSSGPIENSETQVAKPSTQAPPATDLVERVTSASLWAGGHKPVPAHDRDQRGLVGRASSIYYRRDIFEVLGANVRRHGDQRSGGSGKRIGETMSRALGRVHRLPRREISRLRAHGIAQSPLEDIDDLFVVGVTVRRGNV